MRRDAGFTLLETLVALIVLGLLLVGLSQGMRFGLDAYAHESASLAQAGQEGAVNRALRRLIGQARPGQGAGTSGRLALITTLPEVAGSGQLIDAALYLDRQHDLVLAWRAHGTGVALRPPPPARIEVLMRGIAAISIHYWWRQSAFAPPVWQKSGPAGGLPRLIRLRVVPLTGPTGPDLIVGPALAPAG